MTSRTATVRPLSPTRDRQRTQDALVEAANAVFAERGYDAATTREVAERAGFSEGLIHRYFGSKQGLLLAVMETKAAAMLDDFRAALPDCADVREEIEQALLWSLRVFWEHRDFMRVSSARAITDPELGHGAATRVHGQRVDLLLGKIRHHAAAGRIRGDVDLEAVAQSVAGFGYTYGFMAQVVLGMEREYLQRVVRALADDLARGIAAGPERSATGGT